ncbi:M20 metallopeptidase family protein [Bacillus suaedae]|uniref:Amidohydrolase n=1 Tax=Halalkalibacter suaedae TaxID=2822140 RepID=A0A940WYY8_9BACI|nr:M20 family metallopeptidase [Bacillus suaedae]MBP3950664.1 amidohydrolase [Bacillus suaedae]
MISLLRKWRRHLHQFPELSFCEYETTAYIINQVKDLPGITIETGKNEIGIDTGVLVTIGNGRKPIIGLRADIDALPIQELNQHSYCSSFDGVMHACGHDGHTAMLIGAIYRLSELYEKDFLNGTVKCLFQPAEETEDQFGKTGAQYVLESSALDDVESIIALHLDPEIPLGEVKLKEGVVMANVDTFQITVRGTGGHGAYPEQTIDPIWISSLMLPALYSMTSRKLSASDPFVCSVCQLNGGTSTNVIPNTVTLGGTIRTYSDHARMIISKELKSLVNSFTHLGASIEIMVHHGEPALVNDRDMVAILKESIQIVYPDMRIHNQTYGMGGEDFSHFAQVIPGAMMFLGAGIIDVNTSLHQASFDFDEQSLVYGMETLVHSVLLRLRGDQHA